MREENEWKPREMASLVRLFVVWVQVREAWSKPSVLPSNDGDTGWEGQGAVPSRLAWILVISHLKHVAIKKENYNDSESYSEWPVVELINVGSYDPYQVVEFTER